jgi:NarL family two-component system response regulator LiaR
VADRRRRSGGSVGERAFVPDVLLVDPRPLLRRAIENLLQERAFRVVASEASGQRALTVLDERPDVLVLTSLHLADMDGVAFLRQLRGQFPNTVVVVLASPEMEVDVDVALGEGAAVVVDESAEPDDLVTALRQALRRSIFFHGGGGENRGIQPDVLTRRELEVLRLAAEGLSNAQIAQQLWLAEPTVKFHLSNVYKKLGVPNRTGATRYAQQHGLIGDEGARVVGLRVLDGTA